MKDILHSTLTFYIKLSCQHCLFSVSTHVLCPQTALKSAADWKEDSHVGQQSRVRLQKERKEVRVKNK
jgi:hypothetical protein